MCSSRLVDAVCVKFGVKKYVHTEKWTEKVNKTILYFI
jgi:hypothetical protein